MHIPDGMLNTQTAATLWVGAGGAISYASYWIRKHFDSSKIVLMAVLAALIFGLQMLNFPVAGGTSGHFGGGSLAGILLGSWPATIVMTAVLLVQAVFFADGGITTLGANIINMGTIGAFVAPLIYTLTQRISSGYVSKIVGAFLGAFLSMVLSSAAVAVELWASGTAELAAALAAMVFWHTLIGVGEGLITAGVVAYVAKVRPQILDEGATVNRGSLRSVAVALAALALAATCFSFLASPSPDGLEYVFFEEQIGTVSEDTIDGYAVIDPEVAPMPDYVLPVLAGDGEEPSTVSGIAAGVLGAVITGVLMWAVASVLRAGKRPKSGDSQNAEPINAG